MKLSNLFLATGFSLMVSAFANNASASASTLLSTTVVDETSAKEAGFVFSSAFYTIHSPTFRSKTFVTVLSSDDDGSDPKISSSTPQSPKATLNVKWDGVVISKLTIRTELEEAGWLFINSPRLTIQQKETGLKLLVAVEVLGRFNPMAKFLSSLDRLEANISIAYAGVDAPSFARVTVRRAIELGSNQGIKALIKGYHYGTNGFEKDVREAEDLCEQYGFRDIKHVLEYRSVAITI